MQKVDSAKARHPRDWTEKSPCISLIVCAFDAPDRSVAGFCARVKMRMDVKGPLIYWEKSWVTPLAEWSQKAKIIRASRKHCRSNRRSETKRKNLQTKKSERNRKRRKGVREVTKKKKNAKKTLYFQREKKNPQKKGGRRAGERKSSMGGTETPWGCCWRLKKTIGPTAEKFCSREGP